MLEYWRRESEAQLKALGASNGKRTQYTEQPEFQKPDEATMLAQFQSAPRANPMQVGFSQNIERMSPEHRAMIDWAEGFKKKHGIN